MVKGPSSDSQEKNMPQQPSPGEFSETESSGQSTGLLQTIATDLARTLERLRNAGTQPLTETSGAADPLLQKAFLHAPAAMFLATLEGKFLRMNHTLLRSLGCGDAVINDVTPTAFEGSEEVFKIFDKPEDFTYTARYLRSRPEVRMDDIELVRCNGLKRRASLHAARIPDEALTARYGPVGLFVVEFPEKDPVQVARGAIEPLYRELFDNAAEALFQCLPDGELLLANKTLARLFNCTDTEELRMHYPTVGSMLQDAAQYLALTESLNQCQPNTHNQGEATIEAKAHRFEGGELWLQIKAIIIHDAAGHPLMLHGSMRDITLQKTMEARLLREGYRDSLTGLANRSMFLNLLDKSIARARRRNDFGFALVVLSLDSFRSVKEGMGHGVAEELLAEVARRLLHLLRTEDVCARLGNDEFGLILSDVDHPADAIKTLERITQGLSDSVPIQGRDIFPRISSGIVLSDQEQHSSETMLDDADTAMHRAKADALQRFAVFNEAMQLEATERLRVESELCAALENKELVLFYQPIISIPDGTIAGFEALMRWHRPGFGLVGPDTFVPLLEETGLIIPAGQWALQHACRQIKEWQETLPRHKKLFVSVNISAHQLRGDSLVEIVRHSLHSTGINASTLKLELTESLFMEEPQRCLQALTDLQSLGVGLAIDDFGTGYSSLSYLNRLPANTLKIDKCFVQAMRAGQDGEAIVRTIVLLARALGKTVIAEGVETSEQLATVMQLQCEYVQGYYFSKPLPPNDARQLLLRGFEH